MANYKTGAQRYNDRLHKIFDKAKKYKEEQRKAALTEGKNINAIKFYMDYVNHYLTTAKIAEDYKISIPCALGLMEIGKKEREDIIMKMKNLEEFIKEFKVLEHQYSIPKHAMKQLEKLNKIIKE